MARKERWDDSDPIVGGIWTVRFSSWKWFHDYVRQEMLDFNHYVWRGERCDNRKLLPSFDRMHFGKSSSFVERKMQEHLQMFKLSTRGRRGPNPTKLETENDWWALGQHHGLATPLLDWSKSPFVALFFAFEKVAASQTPYRCVYAVIPGQCERASEIIKKSHTTPDRPDIVEFFSPFQDENSRLVNQNGLFSRCSAGKPLDTWIREKFATNTNEGIMLKLLIPDIDREECLRTLNKMNINHLTLYPDLFGASNYANTVASIEKY